MFYMKNEHQVENIHKSDSNFESVKIGCLISEILYMSSTCVSKNKSSNIVMDKM